MALLCADCGTVFGLPADEIALEKLKETLPPSVYARYKEKILAAKEDGRLKAYESRANSIISL